MRTLPQGSLDPDCPPTQNGIAGVIFHSSECDVPHQEVMEEGTIVALPWDWRLQVKGLGWLVSKMSEDF